MRAAAAAGDGAVNGAKFPNRRIGPDVWHLWLIFHNFLLGENDGHTPLTNHSVNPNTVRDAVTVLPRR